MNNQRTFKSSPTLIFWAIFAIKTLPLDRQLRITDFGHPDVFDDLEDLGVVERIGIGATLVAWIPAHPLLLDDLRRLVSIFHLQNALPGTPNSIDRTTIARTAFPEDLTEYCLNLFERLGWALRMVNTWQLTEVGRTLATEFLTGANFVWPDAASRNATPTLLDTLLLLPDAGAPAHVIHQCFKSAAPIVYTIASLDELVKKGFVVRDKALTHTLTRAGKVKALEEYPTPPLAFPILAPLPASAFAPHIIPCVPDITKPHPDAPPKPLEEHDYRVLGVFLSFTTLSDGQTLPKRSSHTSHNAAMLTPGGGYNDSLVRVFSLTDRGYLKREEGLDQLYYSITEKGEAALKDWKAKSAPPKPLVDANVESTGVAGPFTLTITDTHRDALLLFLLNPEHNRPLTRQQFISQWEDLLTSGNANTLLDDLIKLELVLRTPLVGDYFLSYAGTLAARAHLKAKNEATKPKFRVEDDWRVLEVFVDSVALRLGVFTPIALRAHTAAVRAPGSVDDAMTRVINLTERGYLEDDKGFYSLTDLGEEALRSWLNYRGILKTPSDAPSPSTPAQSTPAPEKPASDELTKTVRRLGGRVSRLESEVEQIKKDVNTASAPDKTSVRDYRVDSWSAIHTAPGARVCNYLTKSLESNPSLSDHWITPGEAICRLYLDTETKPSIDQVLASAKCHPSLRVFDDPKYPGAHLIALKDPRPAQYGERFGNAVKISGLAGGKPHQWVSHPEDLFTRVNDILWKQALEDYSDVLTEHGAPFPGKRWVTMPVEVLISRLDYPASSVGELRRILRGRGYYFPAFPYEDHVGFAQMKSALDIENHITWCIEKLFVSAHYWSLPLARVANEVGVSEKALRFVLNLNLSTDWVFSETGAVDLDGRTTAYVSRRAKGPAESPKPSDSPNQEGKWVCAVDLKEVEKKILDLLKSQYVDAHIKAEQMREAWDNREVRVSVASLASQTGFDIRTVIQAINNCGAIWWYSTPTGPATHSSWSLRPDHGFAGFHGVPTLGDIRHWIADQAYAELMKHGANNYTLPFDGLAVALRMPGDTLKVSIKGDDRFFEWYRHVGSLVTSVIGLAAPPVNTAPKQVCAVDQKEVEKKIVWLLRQQYIDAYTNYEKKHLSWNNRECRVSVTSLANRTGISAGVIEKTVEASQCLAIFSGPNSKKFSFAAYVGFIKVPPVSQIHYWITEKAEEVLGRQPNRCGRLEELAAAVGVTVGTLRTQVKDNIRFHVWEGLTGTTVIPMIQLMGACPPRVAPPVNTPPKPTRQRSLMEKVVGWLKANTSGDKPFHSTVEVNEGVLGGKYKHDAAIFECLERAARARNGAQVRLTRVNGLESFEWTWGPALAALRKQTRDARCGIASLLSAYPDEWFSVAEIADKTKYSEVQIERALNLRRHDFPVTTIAGDKPTLYKWHLNGGGK